MHSSASIQRSIAGINSPSANSSMSKSNADSAAFAFATNSTLRACKPDNADIRAVARLRALRSSRHRDDLCHSRPIARLSGHIHDELGSFFLSSGPVIVIFSYLRAKCDRPCFRPCRLRAAHRLGVAAPSAMVHDMNLGLPDGPSWLSGMPFATFCTVRSSNIFAGTSSFFEQSSAGICRAGGSPYRRPEPRRKRYCRATTSAPSAAAFVELGSGRQPGAAVGKKTEIRDRVDETTVWVCCTGMGYWRRSSSDKSSSCLRVDRHRIDG